MGSMDSAFGGSFEDGFEPDDFYESFLAPKFHDFTAPEEPIDPDAYFMAKPGMFKAYATVEGLKPAASKIQKEAPKTVAAQAPPKPAVAAEKSGASTGSATKATRDNVTSVTPLASKPLKNSPMQEKLNDTTITANGSLKPTSLAKKLLTSENDDPNSPTKNSSSDVVAPIFAKHRRIKAQEEKAALTRQLSQKVLEIKPLECKTSVESNSSKGSDAKKASKAKTPVKEVADAAASGHHCKSSRCAAIDTNFVSPVPTKKYLVAKKCTPGSLRKATVPENETAADGVKAKVALEDVFQKMVLDPEEKQVLPAFELKGLKDVPLQEEKAAISGHEIREWVGRLVTFEEKAVSETITDKCTEEQKGPRTETCTEEQKRLRTFLKVASECLENIDLETHKVPAISKQGKKRKSGELIPAGASKRANYTSDETRIKAISKKISQVTEAASSKIPNKLRMRRLSVAKRLSIARTGSRVTNPRPFRLRTQERGAMKEKEFFKKVEEYKAAKEGFHSAFQGLAVAEPKIPAKFLKSGHVFSARRAEPKPQDEKESEAKAMKAGLLPAHKAPPFDHPFRPHRSTKKLTVPQEPKFHTARVSRNCPSHAVAV